MNNMTIGFALATIGYILISFICNSLYGSYDLPFIVSAIAIMSLFMILIEYAGWILDRYEKRRTVARWDLPWKKDKVEMMEERVCAIERQIAQLRDESQKENDDKEKLGKPMHSDNGDHGLHDDGIAGINGINREQ